MASVARSRTRAAIGALVVLLGVAAPATAQSMPDKEAQLKVAFVYQFAMFVEWPAHAFASANSPLIVAVVGRDPFNGELERLLEGKKIGGRPLTFVMLGRPERGRLTATPFHILFVSRSEEDQVSQHLAEIKGRAVLTVSDVPSFSRHGGMIELEDIDARLRFEINRPAAEAVNLRLSSRLLALAPVR